MANSPAVKLAQIGVLWRVFLTSRSQLCLDEPDWQQRGLFGLSVAFVDGDHNGQVKRHIIVTALLVVGLHTLDFRLTAG